MKYCNSIYNVKVKISYLREQDRKLDLYNLKMIFIFSVEILYNTKMYNQENVLYIYNKCINTVLMVL